MVLWSAIISRSKMSYLLPHFKCLPDTFKNHHRATTQILKSRDHTCFRTQCMLSTTSPPTAAEKMVFDLENLQFPPLDIHSNSVATDRLRTAVLDMEKLQLPSLVSHSKSVATDRPCTYIGATGPPMEENIEMPRTRETCLISEEAVIAAVAAEAVALAKAAVKVANEAVMMINDNNSKMLDSKTVILTSDVNYSLFKKTKLSHFAELGQFGAVGELKAAESGLGEKYPLNCPIEESDSVEPTHEQLGLLQAQLSNSITVRSKRTAERKARRARAADRVTSDTEPVNSGSTNQKKRAFLQDVDYLDPLRYLRGTTSASRLLTASEEQELSTGIQDLLKLEKLHEELVERCGAQPTFAQWATAAGVDPKTLRDRIQYGSLCKDKMIKSNIRLVISIAKNYQGAGMNLQDLVQEGCRGLARGAEKFNASKGFKFSTYAHWWIKQAVRRSLSDQSRIIRLPFHMVEATYKVKEARKQLYNENGRLPDDKEVAVAAGLSMKRLSAVLLTPKAPRSLDQKIGMNQNLKPTEVIADPEAETGEELLEKQFMKQDLEKVLNTLSPREKKVIKCRFGLEDGRMKTLLEIGKLMGVSRERIRQIESCAFRKLKNKRRLKHLQQYLK